MYSEYTTERQTSQTGEYSIRWINDLRNISRYEGTPMIHRTTVFTHVMRGRSMALSIAMALRHVGITVDIGKVNRGFVIHDNPEVETRDIPSPIKRSMSDKQKALLRKREAEAVKRLAKRYLPQPLHQQYFREHEEMTEGKTPEAQLVKIIDKLEAAYGEVIHEQRCGNNAFTKVFANYSDSIEEIKAFPLWEAMQQLPLHLDALPTQEDINAYPRIQLDETKGHDSQKFWQTVLAPNVHPIHRLWHEASLFAMHTPGTALFPGWRNQLAGTEGVAKDILITSKPLLMLQIANAR